MLLNLDLFLDIQNATSIFLLPLILLQSLSSDLYFDVKYWNLFLQKKKLEFITLVLFL